MPIKQATITLPLTSKKPLPTILSHQGELGKGSVVPIRFSERENVSEKGLKSLDLVVGGGSDNDKFLKFYLKPLCLRGFFHVFILLISPTEPANGKYIALTIIKQNKQSTDNQLQ